MEKDPNRYARAEAYYEAVKAKAVRLEATHDVVDLKRAWLTSKRIGEWDVAWTQQTERRPLRYFSRYDQHIRCWIPHYEEFIRECAAIVAREILRVHEVSNRRVRLLELGYGTGSLTAKVAQWCSELGRPFQEYGKFAPVNYYDAVDRADQMFKISDETLKRLDGLRRVELHKQTAWREVKVGDPYDVIFGSLITHFMIDRASTDNGPDAFFAACASRLQPHGTLVFADSFAPPSEAEAKAAADQWRNWMVSNGLPEQYADDFLAGNQDMLEACPIEELEPIAERHGFELAEVRDTQVTQFKTVVFHYVGVGEPADR